MPHQIIHTASAPRPVGPYSQAIEAEGLVFISGQIPLDPEYGALKGSSIEEQARQAMRNLKAVLAAAGLARALRIRETGVRPEYPFFSRQGLCRRT